ncbi:MAG: HDOD domain-containing protein [Candidatus Eisenbacteria bacterium]|nr:HDOD domain-containing protein [Candidatus Eisenbacteria bacterium]
MIISQLAKPALKDFVLKIHADWRFASRFFRNLRLAGWGEAEGGASGEKGAPVPPDCNGDLLLYRYIASLRNRSECDRSFLAITLNDRLDPATIWSDGFPDSEAAAGWAEENWAFLSRAIAEGGAVSAHLPASESPEGAGAPVLAIPVSAGQSTIGVVAIRGAPGTDFDPRATRVLKSGAFLLGQTVLEVVGEDQTNNVLYAMIQSLAAALDARDAYTRGHADRVAMYSMVLANELGVESDADDPGGFRDKLRLSALFHDIGKVGVRDCILYKPESLSDEEYDIIKRHPIVGEEILKSSGILDHVIPGVLYHHERIDGTGYPIGLMGDEIPLVARIIGLVDTFDAMTTDRAFRAGMPHEEAIRRIVEDEKRGLFPKDLVEALVRAQEKGLLAHVRVGFVAPGYSMDDEGSLIESTHSGIGDRIPVMPAAVAKLNAMVRDPECDVSRLAEVIQTDEGLVARILKYANSAFYGLPGRIGTIQLAVTILGLVTLRNLVIVAALAELARKLTDEPRDAHHLWNHGIDVGVWCRSLSRRTQGVDPEEAFTAGLLHDIGKNLILRELPEDRLKLKEWLLGEDEARSLERDSIGFDHAQVGGWAAGRWKFPESLVEAVRWHHEPTGSPTADPELERLIWVVHTADILARAESFEPPVLFDALVRKANPTVRRELEPIKDESSLEEIAGEVSEDLEMARTLFAGEVRVGV